MMVSATSVFVVGFVLGLVIGIVSGLIIAAKLVSD